LDIISEFPNWIYMKKHWNQFRMEVWNWRHNGCQFSSNDNMHITFFKTPLRFWLYAKKIHSHIHPLFQKLFIHFNMGWFHLQNDHGPK
jgi:hypothetical protein